MKDYSRVTYFKKILDSAPVSMWSIARDGTYFMCEGQGLSDLNLRPGELVGKNFFELRKDSQHLVECVNRALAGESFRTEVLHQNVWFDICFTPEFGEDGKVLSVHALAINITERKKFEEELKNKLETAEFRNEAKSKFLAHVSHEIRTPMTAILGFTEILKKPMIPEEDRPTYLEKIYRGGHTLLNLVNDLLDISKIESGNATVEKKRVVLNDWFFEIISFLEINARQKNLELKVEFEQPLPKTIYTDVHRARQILTNLIGNAIKFTGHGSITTTVRAQRGTAPTDDVLEFEIRDTGDGISSEQQSKLFKPFAQGATSPSNKQVGSGLGLVISKQWAERLGGSVELVRTEPGKGSCFRVRIKAGPFE